MLDSTKEGWEDYKLHIFQKGALQHLLMAQVLLQCDHVTPP
jgi:hypothetical protein